MKMMLRFSKMHSLGNDFMIVDAVNQSFNPCVEEIQRWADRRQGVGFDQLLLVEPAKDEHTDFFYRIFNADGGEVGQCGNGARCLARFIRDQNLSSKEVLRLKTHTTDLTIRFSENEQIIVELGFPQFSPDNIPLAAAEVMKTYHIKVDGVEYPFHALSVGNPHAVLVVDNVESVPVAVLGKQISEHPLFPEQCNVEFVAIQNAEHIKLRVYERGVGETLACGSGAAAAAVAMVAFHSLNPKIKVSLPGGDLQVVWPDPSSAVSLIGDAIHVYDGVIHCVRVPADPN